MARSRSIPAKIVRPAQSGTFARKRLYSLIDRARPIVWVSGPPGAGKTSLVASYLESRKLRPLWYQVDAGDSDVATVFYYLRLAAERPMPRRRWRLPLLTPEYALGLSTFTRRWFEELFAGLDSCFLLVFDNYQEAAVVSRLHEVLRDALESLPSSGKAAIISRDEPPEALARLRATGQLTSIGWEQLRLTAPETAGIARTKSAERVPAARARTLHAAADGWAAGLVLMLARPSMEPPSATADTRRMQAVFDYFASEILSHGDEETRRVLIECALLPKLTAVQAIALTGSDRAGDILRDLSRRRYFTDVHDDPPTYQYHPLFRQFLLTRANEQIPAARRAALRCKAASLLEQDGLVEDAAAVLRDSEDWEALAGLIAVHAPQFLAQGRASTVTEWLRWVPSGLRERDPWLLLWSGASALGSDPETSYGFFDRAYDAFTRAENGAGALLAWSGAVDATLLQFKSARGLEPWLARLGPLVERYFEAAPREIQFRVSSSAFAARALFGAPETAESARWTMFAEEFVATDPDVTRRILTAHYMGIQALEKGDLARATEVRRTLERLARSQGASPLARVVAAYVEASTHWVSGDLLRSSVAADDGLGIAAATGVHVLDSQLLAIRIYAALSAGDLESAASLLERMADGLDPSRLVDSSHYRYVASWHAHLAGKADSALRLANEALEQTISAATPFPVALCHHGVAVVLNDRGDRKGAREHLEKARAIARAIRSRCVECACYIAEAEFAFDSGDEGREALTAGLQIARSEGYGNILFWRPPVMAALCARALRDGIETDYVRRLIRLRRLDPPAHGARPEVWPWPVRVHALGQFEVYVDDLPLVFAGKAQRKPLALLKALVAFGGSASERALSDVLWPEAQGDAAQQALSVTLHRLRKLLRHEDAVRRHEGRLDLDAQRVWVDVGAMESLLEGARGSPSGLLADHVDSALHLYRGPLLGGDEDEPWILASRDRLRSRILRRLGEAALRCEQDGKADRAVECYLMALDVDDRAEDVHRRLMSLYLRLGRRAEGVAAYHRCRGAIRASLGVPPSQETESLFKRLSAP